MELVKVEFNSNSLEVEPQSQSVVVKDICANLGIDSKRQISKLKSDPTYQSKLIKVQTNGGMQEVFTIPLSKLNGWLFSINPNKVKPEVKAKLIEYKNECFEVLHRYFEIKHQVKQTTQHPTHHQIIGYKSQLSQRNKRIEFLENQVMTLQKMSENQSTIETPVKVMELIDKGLKYDELNEKYKALDTQYSMFKLMGNEALNKMKYLQEQMLGAIPYLDNVLNNGMERDKQLGWKPIES